MYLFILMCQILNILWKTTVLNVACVSAYFCGKQENNLGYNFAAALNLLNIAYGSYITESIKYGKREQRLFSTKPVMFVNLFITVQIEKF